MFEMQHMMSRREAEINVSCCTADVGAFEVSGLADTLDTVAFGISIQTPSTLQTRVVQTSKQNYTKIVKNRPIDLKKNILIGGQGAHRSGL